MKALKGDGKTIVDIPAEFKDAAEEEVDLPLPDPELLARFIPDDSELASTGFSQVDENGDLKVEGTVKFLDHFFEEVDAWYAQITK